MKEKPILMSAEMVRAVLDGRKTQTRRIVKPQPVPIPENIRCRLDKSDHWWACDAAQSMVDLRDAAWLSPFGKPGDRLWVRETHVIGYPYNGDELQAYDENGNSLPMHVWYREDSTPNGYTSNRGAVIQCWYDDNGYSRDTIPWKPSIHMPRWASRLTLEITEVRVQRLQDISAKDIIAEGAVTRPHFDQHLGKMPVSAFDGKAYPDLRSLWGHGWESIYGKGSWNSNPWVWAITFKPIV